MRRSGREPLLLTAAYLPEPLARRLKPSIPSRASVLTMLDRLGPPTAAVRCSVSAVLADIEAAHALQVPLGSPLLRLRWVLSDQ